MLVSAKNYWTKILPMCIKHTNKIPVRYYNLITPYKTLQKFINKEVIKEFITDSLNMLIDEIIWDNSLKYRDNYYITSSYSTNDIEDIIKEVFKVEYINDEFVKIKPCIK